MRYFVVRSGDHWAVELDGDRLAEFPTQGQAEEKAFAMARNDETAGHDAEVNVQGKHGRWEEERTYGHDPRNIPG
jgi:hypothetical protein